MGFGKNKKVKKEIEEDEEVEEDEVMEGEVVEEEEEEEQVKQQPKKQPKKKEGEIRIVTGEQLLNLKIDGLGEYIKSNTQYLKALEEGISNLGKTIKLALED